METLLKRLRELPGAEIMKVYSPKSDRRDVIMFTLRGSFTLDRLHAIAKSNKLLAVEHSTSRLTMLPHNSMSIPHKDIVVIGCTLLPEQNARFTVTGNRNLVSANRRRILAFFRRLQMK